MHSKVYGEKEKNKFSFFGFMMIVFLVGWVLLFTIGMGIMIWDSHPNVNSIHPTIIPTSEPSNSLMPKTEPSNIVDCYADPMQWITPDCIVTRHLLTP
jgi:hypothetical protein